MINGPTPLSPPPTRGSTHTPPPAKGSSTVSPAHAGIDRHWVGPRRSAHCLPRPRGDRPLYIPRAFRMSTSPPPTRGSTEAELIGVADTAVSPAHAGIDPVLGEWLIDFIRLPRPRGDRPATRSAVHLSTPSPPPTRGSTCGRAEADQRRRVSPAHAGIDPHYQSDAPRDWCLPRPRGDRPSHPVLDLLANPSPPPTRGSTQIAQAESSLTKVSPAHAGIDLKPTPCSPPWTGLPRPRGDRPRSRRSVSRC